MKSLFGQLLCAVIILMIGTSLGEAQDAQGDIFVEARVDNAAPYIGQQIIYTFKLYDSVDTTNPLYAPSDFDGFWRVDIGVTSQVSEQINGRTYTVTTIETALYPTQSGEISVQPASVVLPETVFRGETRLSASVLPIQVQPLPTGEPSAFDGAVGAFAMAASLDRQSAPLGEPITMMLTLSGTGNVEQLPPPSLPSNLRSSITAGAFSSETQNGMVIGKRAYTIVFYPSVSGKQVLPPITLNYFDPISLIYRSVSTPSVEIEVMAAASSVDSTSNEVAVNRLKLKPIGALAGNASNLSVFVFLILLLLPVLGIVGAVVWRQFQIRQKARTIDYNKQQALRSALEQIDKLKKVDGQLAYIRMRAVLQEYIAHKVGVNVDSLKNSDLLSVIVANNVPEERIALIQELNDQIDEGVFAPIIAETTVFQLDKFKKTLTRVDKNWVQM